MCPVPLHLQTYIYSVRLPHTPDRLTNQPTHSIHPTLSNNNWPIKSDFAHNQPTHSIHLESSIVLTYSIYQLPPCSPGRNVPACCTCSTSRGPGCSRHPRRGSRHRPRAPCRRQGLHRRHHLRPQTGCTPGQSDRAGCTCSKLWNSCLLVWCGDLGTDRLINTTLKCTIWYTVQRELT